MSDPAIRRLDVELMETYWKLRRGDEGFKATAYLKEAAAPAEEGSKEVPGTNIAFGFSETVFEWMASPGNAWRGQRMGKAMQQLHRMANGNVITGTTRRLICPLSKLNMLHRCVP